MVRNRVTGALVAVGLVAALGLTACGDTTSAPPAPSAVDSGTRTITDASGARVTIPAKPRNVVTLAETDLDAAVALGVKPIGAGKSRQGDSVAGYLADRVAGVTLVGEITEPDLEAIATLNPRPDVILYGHFIDPDPKQIADLNAIAPTVITSMVKDDWRASLKGVADALNLTDKADALLAEYTTAVSTTRAALGANADAEVSLARWAAQGPSYLRQQHFASLIVSELGLRRPAAQMTEGTGPSQPVSMEKLDVLDADWLFLGTLNQDGSSALAEAGKNPAWSTLRVVKAGKVVPVDGVPWTSRGGPVAARIVLDDIRKAMSAG